MKISVQIFPGLIKYSPTGEPRFDMDVEVAATVDRVLKDLAIPPKPDKIILVNGRQARPGRVLTQGDLMVVFPPMAGG